MGVMHDGTMIFHEPFAAVRESVHLFPASGLSAFHDHWMNHAALGTDFKHTVSFNVAVVFQIRLKQLPYPCRALHRTPDISIHGP